MILHTPRMGRPKRRQCGACGWLHFRPVQHRDRIVRLRSLMARLICACFNGLHCVPDPPAAVAEMSRSLCEDADSVRASGFGMWSADG